MKIFNALVIVMYCTLTIYGQDTVLVSHSVDILENCGTPLANINEVKEYPWYNNSNWFTTFSDSVTQNENNFSSKLSNTPSTYYVPIHFWMYRISDNNPGGQNSIPNSLDLKLSIDKLNNGFQSNGMPIRFYISCITYVDAPDALEMGIAESTFWGQLHHDGSCVNVHVKDQGRNLFNPTVDALFIKNVFKN